MMKEVKAANHEAITVNSKKLVEEEDLEKKWAVCSKNKAMREEEEETEKRSI